jgi:hypothetical protein
MNADLSWMLIQISCAGALALRHGPEIVETQRSDDASLASLCINRGDRDVSIASRLSGDS